jgi:hypothetical protein
MTRELLQECQGHKHCDQRCRPVRLRLPLTLTMLMETMTATEELLMSSPSQSDSTHDSTWRWQRGCVWSLLRPTQNSSAERSGSVIKTSSRIYRGSTSNEISRNYPFARRSHFSEQSIFTHRVFISKFSAQVRAAEENSEYLLPSKTSFGVGPQEVKSYRVRESRFPLHGPN